MGELTDLLTFIAEKGGLIGLLAAGVIIFGYRHFKSEIDKKDATISEIRKERRQDDKDTVNLLRDIQLQYHNALISMPNDIRGTLREELNQTEKSLSLKIDSLNQRNGK